MGCPYYNPSSIYCQNKDRPLESIYDYGIKVLTIYDQFFFCNADFVKCASFTTQKEAEKEVVNKQINSTIIQSHNITLRI